MEEREISVFVGCIPDENDNIEVLINGKLYDKIHKDSLTLDKWHYFHSIAINKDHEHNK